MTIPASDIIMKAVLGGGLTQPDKTPDQFTFADQTNVATSTVIESAPINVMGIDSFATPTISATGGEYSINASAYTSASGVVSLGDSIRARHTSSALPATNVNTVVTIGGVSDEFRSTTAVGGVIWETNFAQDGAYSLFNTSVYETSTVPNGVTAMKASGGTGSGGANAGWYGQPTGGKGGSVAMRLIYPDKESPPGFSQPTNSLSKHLTEDINTGYPELYFRFHVKFPNLFKIGDGTGADHWKWFRLWQNTSYPNSGSPNPGYWSENRHDSYYVVGNFVSSPTYGTTPNITLAANSEVADLNARLSGSVSGPRTKVNWFQSGVTQPNFKNTDGYFEHMGNGAWDIDYTTNVGWFVDRSTQDWHTIEYRIKCATSGNSEDGIVQLWFDGALQADWTRIQTNGNYKQCNVTNVTNAITPVVTVNASISDVWQTGDSVTFPTISSGMTELSGNTYTVTYISDTSFSLDGINSSAYGTWSGTKECNYFVTPSGWGGLWTGPGTMAEPGFNWIGFFDNMSKWNSDYSDAGVEGWIDINDLCVATSRIGHDYVVTGDGS